MLCSPSSVCMALTSYLGPHRAILRFLKKSVSTRHLLIAFSSNSHQKETYVLLIRRVYYIVDHVGIYGRALSASRNKILAARYRSTSDLGLPQ